MFDLHVLHKLSKSCTEFLSGKFGFLSNMDLQHVGSEINHIAFILCVLLKEVSNGGGDGLFLQVFRMRIQIRLKLDAHLADAG